MQMNRVEVAGFLSKRPEIRYLPSGTPVANVRLGQSYRFQDGNKQWQERTNWHNLSFYGDLSAVALATFQLCGLAGIRINASPSLPIGLYSTSTNPGAGLIEFCPAEPFASLASSRGYRDRGTCPDGATPLMKPIVAQAGDTVDLSGQGI